MRSFRFATAWLAALGLLVGVLGSCVSAVTTHNIVTLVDGTQYGWKHAECGKNMGGSKSSVKAGFSVYDTQTKGSPGPKPIGSYYLHTDMEGSLEGTYPGQAWLGTDRYSGTYLSSITRLSYWANLDFRGCDYAPLKDTAGHTIANEFKLDWIASQPPQMQLHCKANGGADWFVLMYRPWSTVGEGTPENPEFKGFGPRDGSLCRMWDEYDCLNEGYWFVKDCSTGEEYYDITWSQFIMVHPDAFLATPPKATTTYGYPNKLPAFGTPAVPTFGSATSTTSMATSLNIVLGARLDWDGNFPYNWRAWYTESWNAYASVDFVSIACTNGQTTYDEDFDFQHPSYVPNPANNKVKCMNNRAVFDQGCYAPSPRDRQWLTSWGTQPADWWGQPVPGTSTIVPAKMNSVQRVGNYNYLNAIAPYVGALFAVYGKVSNVNGDFFDIDDGSGVPLPCYCPNADSVPIEEDHCYRLVGTPYGQCPYEWYYNNFHIVYWDYATGEKRYSTMFPWRFDTYAWNVTPLY